MCTIVKKPLNALDVWRLAVEDAAQRRCVIVVHGMRVRSCSQQESHFLAILGYSGDVQGSLALLIAGL